MWSTTVTHAQGNTVVGLDRFVQPRIEPEVVFKLRERPQHTGSPSEILRSVEWMAPGFEIVHCHFPDWKFTVADATADFGVHGALVVGTPLFIDDDNRDAIAAELSRFELTLSRDGVEVDRGLGANVLDGPAHALAHLVQVLADQPEHQPLDAGEIITTGTITNMWPITGGERWTSDDGSLGLDGLTVSFS
jgi:2-oxo-3-hexenedioate decarboxylase